MFEFNKLVVADWDSGIIMFQRMDGSIHRLFELDRGSSLIKVGDGAISNGLNLRVAEMLPEINCGEQDSTSPGRGQALRGFRAAICRMEHTQHGQEVLNNSSQR